jgi:hypothetical protein
VAKNSIKVLKAANELYAGLPSALSRRLIAPRFLMER